LGYGYTGLKRLVDIVGPAFAKEIFYTARQFDAQEALAMGLVNRVVPAAELETYVKSITDMICANAPLTIKAVKFTVGEIIKDDSKRNVARSANWWSTASPAAIIPKAAPPSWRSASRFSPARKRRRPYHP
jgi:enoyl-CoA hydratase/carnithine racemase